MCRWPSGWTSTGWRSMADSAPTSPTANGPSGGAPLRVLVDTNVVLDVLLARGPWASQAKPILDAHDSGRVTLYLPASVLTDICYIRKRQVGIERAKAAVKACVGRYKVLLVDRGMLAARHLQGICYAARSVRTQRASPRRTAAPA